MKRENAELNEVLSSCRKILHVNNGTEEEDPQLIGRTDSRRILLTHLSMCREVYHPVELDSINERIQSHMEESDKLQKQLEDLDRQLKERDRLSEQLRQQLEQQ